MSQKGNAGKDLVQIGRDYFKHIQLNILSGNWGLAIIALVPLLLFLYGVKATGDTVAEVAGVKPSLSELPQNSGLLQAKDAEIGKLKKQVEALQRINGTSAKDQKQVEALQKTLDDRQTELDNQKNLIQQKDQKMQTLEAQINDLKAQSPKASGSIGQQSGSQEPPPGTAPKSWCLQIASIVKGNADLGMDTSGMKAAMEEQNCRSWGVSTP